MKVENIILQTFSTPSTQHLPDWKEAARRNHFTRFQPPNITKENIPKKTAKKAKQTTTKKQKHKMV